MRVTAAFSKLLRLEGVRVKQVGFGPGRVVVEVALRRRRLICPRCSFSTAHRVHEQDHDSVWRHLDLGVWRLEVRARLRRLACPVHGVRVEAVPFARPGAKFTRDFEQLVAWLATRTDKTAVTRLVRIDWDTVGRIVERVTRDELDPDRLDGLFELGIDEVSWRKQHRYLTLVSDHQRGCVIWGAPGAGQAAADAFFDVGPRAPRRGDYRQHGGSLGSGHVEHLSPCLRRAHGADARFHMSAAIEVARTSHAQSPEGDVHSMFTRPPWPSQRSKAFGSTARLSACRA